MNGKIDSPDTGTATPAIHRGAEPVIIEHVRLLDPHAQIDVVADVSVERGAAQVLEPGAEAAGVRRIDGEDLWLMPGVVDLCARLQERGQTDQSSFTRETSAALARGITVLCLPSDTRPCIDDPSMVTRVQDISAAAGGAQVLPLGALTQGLEGSALAEMDALKRAGCVGVSNAGRPLADARTARRALEYAAGLGLTVHVQPQDASLAAGGCAHDGAVACRLGLPPIPVAAETVALAQWLALVEDTGARVHFGRLSSAQGVRLVAAAKARRLPVTADVAAHQLFLCDEDIEGFDAQCHVIPPLRDRADRTALRAALAEGTLDALCSDHQPREPDAKTNPFPMTQPGISALDTLLALGLRLVAEGVLTPLQLAQRLSAAPAAVLGGSRRSDAAAGWILIDPAASWRLTPDSMLSEAHNTPFLDQPFRGLTRRVFLPPADHKCAG
ncbi:MAG TPA: dihydroorotase [Nevskiaceae bacterium]